jgi:citrate synthase
MTGSTATLTEAPLPKPEGLEGVVAASTALSHVFGEEGRLVYRGYDIHELANNATFEDVAYLLWVGHLPTKSELVKFQAKLDASRALPAAAIEVLRQMPADAQPMDVLRTGISSVGPLMPDVFTETPDLDQAMSLSALFPSVLATFFRLRRGSSPSSRCRG